MKTNRKCIFVLGIFICFLICISHACAYQGVDNSTSVVDVADNSHSSDLSVHHSDVLSVSNSDLTNMSQDKHLSHSLMSSVPSHDKLEKRHDDKTDVKDNITVGNFSLLNKELSDFNDNRYYRIVEYGHSREIHKIADPTQFDKVHTFNLTRDYVYDDSTDKAFINGIPLFTSANKELYKNLIINGNGHFIDGKGLACIFKIAYSNVQICNVTFKNLNTIHNYYHEEVLGSRFPYLEMTSNSMAKSPIVWIGNDGKLTNCTFIDNIGSCGGSIFWQGNNGIIEHNKFINNRAVFLGGFAYIEGENNFIHDNLVVNCEARLDYDALYVRNLSSNNVCKMSYIKVNKTNSSFFCPDVVDGLLMNVSSSALRTIYVTLDYECIDVTPVVYRFLFYGHNYFIFDGGVTVSAVYDDVEQVLTLTLSKFSSPTLEMRKVLNIGIDDDFSTTFNRLVCINGVFQVIKHCTINNVNDYKNANALQASTVISEYKALKKLKLENETYKFDTIMPVLDVKFNKTLSIDSSLTWTPKGFDLIYINGANSLIHTKNDQRAEKKFVDWEGDSMFVASNLRVSGFNNAFKNIASQMLLVNIEVFGNKMDYIVDKDYGAGILNTGVVYCTNCTFHDNKAKYGAAIYNQGFLVVTNCSFYSNNGYGKGSDIVNVDKGIVSIDGKNYDSCGGDKIVYMESMSSKWQTIIKVACYGGSCILGAVAGLLTANPLVGIAVGAALGVAVGTVGTVVVCSNVYDVNFSRWACALTLILGSAGMGAVGGSIGASFGSVLSPSTTTTFTLAEDSIAKSSVHKFITSVMAFTVKQAEGISMSQGGSTIIGAKNDVLNTLTIVLGFAGSMRANSALTSSYNALSYFLVTESLLAGEMLGAICVPTVCYINPNLEDMSEILAPDSYTFILSSDFVSGRDSKVDSLFVGSVDKIPFAVNDVLKSIYSIGFNSPSDTLISN